jgi:hypothetical protein
MRIPECLSHKRDIAYRFNLLEHEYTKWTKPTYNHY